MLIKRVVFELGDETTTAFVEFTEYKAQAFQAVMRKALNTWDKAPEHLIQLSDLIEDVNSRGAK